MGFRMGGNGTQQQKHTFYLEFSAFQLNRSRVFLCKEDVVPPTSFYNIWKFEETFYSDSWNTWWFRNHRRHGWFGGAWLWGIHRGLLDRCGWCNDADGAKGAGRWKISRDELTPWKFNIYSHWKITIPKGKESSLPSIMGFQGRW